jgi:hypothetical protein
MACFSGQQPPTPHLHFCLNPIYAPVENGYLPAQRSHLAFKRGNPAVKRGAVTLPLRTVTCPESVVSRAVTADSLVPSWDVSACTADASCSFVGWQ